MIFTKNSYGVTSVFKRRSIDKAPVIGEVKGSALDRTKEQTEEAFIKRLISKPLIKEDEKDKKERQPKVMSRRTKTKIRNKVLVFSRISKYFNFLTLTFVNEVTDENIEEEEEETIPQL